MAGFNSSLLIQYNMGLIEEFCLPSVFLHFHPFDSINFSIEFASSCPPCGHDKPIRRKSARQPFIAFTTAVKVVDVCVLMVFSL